MKKFTDHSIAAILGYPKDFDKNSKKVADDILKRHYNKNKYPYTHHIEILANKLNTTTSKIKTWYRTQRQEEKNKVLHKPRPITPTTSSKKESVPPHSNFNHPYFGVVSQRMNSGNSNQRLSALETSPIFPAHYNGYISNIYNQINGISFGSQTHQEPMDLTIKYETPSRGVKVPPASIRPSTKTNKQELRCRLNATPSSHEAIDQPNMPHTEHIPKSIRKSNRSKKTPTVVSRHAKTPPAGATATKPSSAFGMGLRQLVNLGRSVQG